MLKQQLPLVLISCLSLIMGCDNDSICGYVPEYKFSPEVEEMHLKIGDEGKIIKFQFYPLKPIKLKFHSSLDEQIYLTPSSYIKDANVFVIPQRSSPIISKEYSQASPLTMSVPISVRDAKNGDAILDFGTLGNLYLDGRRSVLVGANLHPVAKCPLIDEGEGFLSDKVRIHVDTRLR